MQNHIKILTVFGTRPEVIKLAPFIKAVQDDDDCLSITCATTQHRELQYEALELFNIKADYDLDIMRDNQDLSYISCEVLKGITRILTTDKPDFVVVQGDTSTAFISALAAFYQKIPVVHIEAGLRTGNMISPFPEESNRVLISKIATLHMTPTEKSYNNLVKEGIINNVFTVGNTIVDSVEWGIQNFVAQDSLVKKLIHNTHEKKILITVHRRENFGKPLENICAAIRELCLKHHDVQFIWPVHPNPNVHAFVHSNLNDIANLTMIAPLTYNDLLILIRHCHFLISDSGGIQEEASILGKKIIVLREETERMEIIDAGIGVLVGADRAKIVKEAEDLFHNENQFSPTQTQKTLYGSPGVSHAILQKIKDFYNACH